MVNVSLAMPNIETFSERESAATRIWRSNGRREGTIQVYLRWVRRFEQYVENGVGKTIILTRHDVVEFAAAFAVERGLPREATINYACIALKSWSGALHLAGYTIPEWEPASIGVPPPPLLAEYIEFRRHHAGASDRTIQIDVRAVLAFLSQLQNIGRSPSAICVSDADDFITALAGRVCTKTVIRACTSLRCFLRFLHFRAYLAHDVAASVAAPRMLPANRPPRALAWEEVQRLLNAVDVGSRTGRRDYALLLLMATYGMGIAEALHLQLSDIDWRAGTIHMVRPKTGVECLLPLLPGVANAIVAYLRDGRPSHSAARALFVKAVAPYGPMSAGAVQHAIRQHGRIAGLSPAKLSGHVLRHSHACRQIELGALPKVVSDILGHRDPASTSNYFRVATERLRELALPVPK